MVLLELPVKEVGRQLVGFDPCCHLSQDAPALESVLAVHDTITLDALPSHHEVVRDT